MNTRTYMPIIIYVEQIGQLRSEIVLLMQSILGNLRVLRNGNADRLRRLNAYVANTAGIYNEPERLLGEAYRFFLRIEYTELCRATGNVSMPDMARVDEIIAARDIVNSLFTVDDYGNEIFDENLAAHMIAKGQEHLSDVEWLALTKLFDDPRMTLERIADVSAIAIRLSGGNVIPYENARVTLCKLGNLATERLVNETSILLMRGDELSAQERARLEALLQRAQLFTFIADIPTHRFATAGPFSDSFDFSYFSDGRLYFRMQNSRGVFGLDNFPASTLDDFLGVTSYLSDRYRRNAIRALADIEANAPGWLDFGGSTLKSLIMPKNDAVTAGGIAFNFLDMLVQLEQHGITLSNAQTSHLHAMTMLAFNDLGGGMASIETISGYRFITGNTGTRQATVNLAGLGMSEREAVAILSDLSNEEKVAVGAFVEREAGGWHDFANELLGVYQYNFEAITAQFPSLNLEYTTMPISLPLPVLREVISIHGGGGGNG